MKEAKNSSARFQTEFNPRISKKRRKECKRKLMDFIVLRTDYRTSIHEIFFVNILFTSGASLFFLSSPSSGLFNLFPVRLRLLILCLRLDRIWSDSFYRKIEDNIHSARSLLIDLLTAENLPFPRSVGYAMGRVSPRLSSWDIQTYPWLVQLHENTISSTQSPLYWRRPRPVKSLCYERKCFRKGGARGSERSSSL